jgi:hypothetical protein
MPHDALGTTASKRNEYQGYLLGGKGIPKLCDVTSHTLGTVASIYYCHLQGLMLAGHLLERLRHCVSNCVTLEIFAFLRCYAA